MLISTLLVVGVKAVLASSDILSFDFTTTSVSTAGLRRRGLELPIYNELFQQRYVVNLTVGTPPQRFAITLDTGSSDIWFPASNSSGCPPSGCPPGTFDPTKSSTFKNAGVVFNDSFGLTPGNTVVGEYFQDVVEIGNATLPHMTLALGNVPKTLFEAGLYGIMGLSARPTLPGPNNPTSPLFGGHNDTIPTLYDELLLHGYIKRRAFSMWLNDQYAATGRVIFGAIDKTKYHGELVSIPLQLNNEHLFAFAVALTSVSRTDSHGTEILTSKNYAISAIFDSGAPYMYLPTEVANATYASVKATMVQGAAFVDCSLRNDDASFDFGLGGPAGPKISIPYSSLILPYGFPQGFGNVTAKDGTKLCYFGINETPGPIILLGDTFIRSAYLVYDVDNSVIAIAPVKYNVATEDIVPIPKGTALPGVTSTNSFMLPLPTSNRAASTSRP